MGGRGGLITCCPYRFGRLFHRHRTGKNWVLIFFFRMCLKSWGSKCASKSQVHVLVKVMHCSLAQTCFEMASPTSGRPRCPGCNYPRGLSTLSAGLRGELWRLYECVVWSWFSDRQAYWHLCVPCHNFVLEHIPRAGRANRYNRGPSYLRGRERQG